MISNKEALNRATVPKTTRINDKRRITVDPQQNLFSVKFTTLPGEQLSCFELPSTSLVAQMVKNPPAVLETWVQSLDQEDPLEKGMATHSSILAWRISWTKESSRLQSMGLQRVIHD